MKDRLMNTITVLVLSIAMAAGCNETGDFEAFQGPDPAGSGSLTVALDGTQSLLASPFRIRLYRGVPASLDDKPYFQSDCTPARRGFTVNKLKRGTDYVLVFEAFDTPTCEPGSRIGLGIRGEVAVTSEGTGEAVYYIQVNASGNFTRFPIPGGALSNPNPPVPCSEDEACRQLVECPVVEECRFPRTVECDPEEACPTGTKVMQYQVHPAATCVSGYCRLQSLFPLNSRVSRAFHVAASSADGNVSLLGGVTEARARTLVVVGPSEAQGNPDSERFSADLSLFSMLGLDRDLGAGLALTATGRIGEDILFLAGGTASIGMDIVGERAVPWPGPAVCGNADCPMALSSQVWAVDLVRGTAMPSSLPVGTVAAQIAGVPGPAGMPRVFIRSGLVQGTAQGEVRLGREAWICDADEEYRLTCEPLGEVAERSGRFMSAGVCLTEASGGLCEQYLILGGNTAGGAFAELFSAADGSLTSLTPLSGVPETLFGAVAVNVGGRIVVFGGGRQPRKVDAEPMLLTINTDRRTIEGSPLDLGNDRVTPLLRLFHTATPLVGGRDVLVVGGLDTSLTPTRTASLVRFEGGVATIVDQWEGLAAPRAGHQAVRIRGGLLGDGILVTGGLDSLRGVPTFAEGAEIYMP